VSRTAPDKSAAPPAGPDGGARDFIRAAVDEDVRAGRYQGRVHTRFPPEPNAYLHIGHAKALYVSYGVAQEYGGKFNLRFDDTNPLTEEAEYVDAIVDDARWLGADWQERLFFASDYFEEMYARAKDLIRKGKAYVCDLTPEQMRELRGTRAVREDGRVDTPPGRDSPHRDRSVDENLDLFERMRRGEFPNGAKTLRAKIDMAHPNLNMRDPVMYRIQRAAHHRQGDAWCIYPTYDWAHGLEDSIEGITHSLCSLEYENHRPLYDWFLDALGVHHPRQIEFARLNLTHTVLSKRRLLELVRGGHVRGWDDPRMPTLCGLRRRGVPPEAVRAFCERIGVSKADSWVDVQFFEHCVREDLNRTAPRVMGVLSPLKVVIENYPEAKTEEFDAVNNPEDPSAGTRKVPFGRTLHIERDDFREDPPRKFHRLAPGREVRLRYAYLITCREAVKDAQGRVVELRCTYDPATRGGDAPDGRKVRGTLHWVSARHAVAAQVRLVGPLFAAPRPGEGKDSFLDDLDPRSLEVVDPCYVEPSLSEAPAGHRCQFERIGYFCVDPDTRPGRPVLNRTVTLKDTWAKIEKKQAHSQGKKRGKARDKPSKTRRRTRGNKRGK